MNKDLKNALRSTRDMDEYLEVHSSQEIIDAIKESAGQETLRDQFAGQALSQGMAVLVASKHNLNEYQLNQLAVTAYLAADAMLKARVGVVGAPGNEPLVNSTPRNS